jgi:cephalosporin hydroxylase
MRVTIDTDAKTIDADGKTLDIYGKDAFELVSDIWLKLSWNQKYSYTFTWLGRPIIQHPDDVMRIQEAIATLKPDVVIETGVAHGGSLVFYASLLKAMGYGGRVIGVDIEIRKHNRAAIEAHVLSPEITLIEGDAVAPAIVDQVRREIKPGAKVLIILDSNHTYAHVAKELEAYGPLVSVGSYVVATDGIMRLVHDTPRGKPGWDKDNPANAAEDFVAKNPNFVIEEPKWIFNESDLDKSITAWPSAWLKRVS